MTSLKKFPKYIEAGFANPIIKDYEEWRVDTADQLQKRIDELNSDDLKKKSWDTWIREYEGFMIAKKELEKLLEALRS